MRTRLLASVTSLAVALGACGGGDGGTGPSAPTFESIAGAYDGALAGLTQGVALSATFGISLAQSQGSLSGSYSLSGTLTDGVDVVGIAGAGSVTGTIAAGGNPSVNLTFKTSGCPNYQANFSGAYDSVNRKLTISGPIDVLSGNCAVLLSYVGTIILSR